MILGNIVTDIEIEDDIFFKKYSFDNMVGMDSSIPTIYIGYYTTKELFGKLNPIEKVLSDGKMYWTFAKKENDREFNRDMYAFKQYCYKEFSKNIKYCYITPIMKLTTLKRFMNHISNNLSNIIIVRGGKNMIYMYDGKTIYGVNLEVMKLSGVNIDKLINRLYKGCKHYKDFKDYKLEVRNICTYLNSEMYATLF